MHSQWTSEKALSLFEKTEREREREREIKKEREILVKAFLSSRSEETKQQREEKSIK